MKLIKITNRLNSIITVSLLIAIGLINILKAETESYYSFDVTVSGKGQPIIFIHGYASEGTVWNETVNLLSSDYECHVLQLAGFAGRKAIDEEEFLPIIRDEVAEYIKKKKLKNVIVAGHSLGGFLSLWIASEYPDLVSKIVSVDGLPFLGTVINPGATSESMMPMAKEQFRYDYDFEPGKETFSDEQRRGYLSTMTIKENKIDELLKWTKKSDGRTLNQSMFELMITDIREDIKKITSPVLVFGAWIAYKQYGSTRESTEKLYTSLYKNVKDFRIELTDKGKHFIMWDDFDWYSKTLKEFLSE